MYGILPPDDELVLLFQASPYQGQNPEQAAVIFCGTDANYSEKLSKHEFFERIIEYHQNPVAFWKNYTIHHPFLLGDYPFNKNKDGVPYHRNFSKLDLKAKQHADHISFLEILNVPTIGNRSEDKKLFFNFLCPDYLKYIDRLIRGGGHKLFFVSKGFLDTIREIKEIYPNLYGWYEDAAEREFYLKEINGNKIKETYHFSSSYIHAQIDEIKTAIKDWLNPSAIKFVCPNPPHWSDIYQKLYDGWSANMEIGDSPPVPLILNGWVTSGDNEKHARWLATVCWAEAHDLLHLIPEIDEQDQYRICGILP